MTSFAASIRLALLGTAFGFTTAAADTIPCSLRYSRAMHYPLPLRGDPQAVLTPWGLSSDQWGWDRMRIVSHGNHGALRVFYPKGSINPANDHAPQGGAGILITGHFKKTTAACLQYRVYFPEDFAFGKGGKLPGLFGGRDPAGKPAAACRAGSDGFSTRYMWRENGAGSLYAYFPGKTARCGEYIGKGAWYFKRGEWTWLEQEVVLNDPDQKNGIVRVWVNGKQVIDQTALTLRTKDSIEIDGVFFVSFFGGKEAEWASPADQAADFADLKVFFSP